MENSKKRKVSFNGQIHLLSLLTRLVCLICYEKLANNKKSNVPRNFQNKHAAFAQKYPDGDERKKPFRN